MATNTITSEQFELQATLRSNSILIAPRKNRPRVMDLPLSQNTAQQTYGTVRKVLRGKLLRGKVLEKQNVGGPAVTRNLYEYTI